MREKLVRPKGFPIVVFAMQQRSKRVWQSVFVGSVSSLQIKEAWPCPLHLAEHSARWEPTDLDAPLELENLPQLAWPLLVAKGAILSEATAPSTAIEAGSFLMGPASHLAVLKSALWLPGGYMAFKASPKAKFKLWWARLAHGAVELN